MVLFVDNLKVTLADETRFPQLLECLSSPASLSVLILTVSLSGSGRKNERIVANHV